MYESYYGLRGKPFRLTPDPNCFFASCGHHKALAYLCYAIYRGEGFGVVAGAAGTGKTTLMRTLAAELPRNEVVVVEEMELDSALDTPLARPPVAPETPAIPAPPASVEPSPPPRQLPPRITELADHYLHAASHYHGPAAGVEALEESLEGAYGEYERLRSAALLLRKKQSPAKKREREHFGWAGDGVVFDSMTPIWLLVAMSVSILLTVYYLLIHHP